MSDAEDLEVDASLDARVLDLAVATTNARADTLPPATFSQSPMRPVQNERLDEDSPTAFGNASLTFATVVPPTPELPLESGRVVGPLLTRAFPNPNDFESGRGHQNWWSCNP